jgi:hypothetical protein
VLQKIFALSGFIKTMTKTSPSGRGRWPHAEIEMPHDSVAEKAFPHLCPLIAPNFQLPHVRTIT